MAELDFCKKCSNRAVSRAEGVICGLTSKKPDFGLECPSFQEDPIQAKRLDRHQKNFNDREVNKESGLKAIGTGFTLTLVSYLMLLLPMPPFVAILVLIFAFLGKVFIIYGIIKLVTLNRKTKGTGGNARTVQANKSDDIEVF